MMIHYYPKLHDMTHSLSFECFHCFKGTNTLFDFVFDTWLISVLISLLKF